MSLKPLLNYHLMPWVLRLLLVDINELPQVLLSANELLKALAPAESSGIPELTCKLSRGIVSDTMPIIDPFRRCLCFTPGSFKWIGIVKPVFLERGTSITSVGVGM